MVVTWSSRPAKETICVTEKSGLGKSMMLSNSVSYLTRSRRELRGILKRVIVGVQTRRLGGIALRTGKAHSAVARVGPNLRHDAWLFLADFGVDDGTFAGTNVHHDVAGRERVDRGDHGRRIILSRLLFDELQTRERATDNKRYNC